MGVGVEPGTRNAISGIRGPPPVGVCPAPPASKTVPDSGVLGGGDDILRLVDPRPTFVWRLLSCCSAGEAGNPRGEGRPTASAGRCVEEEEEGLDERRRLAEAKQQRRGKRPGPGFRRSEQKEPLCAGGRRQLALAPLMGARTLPWTRPSRNPRAAQPGQPPMGGVASPQPPWAVWVDHIPGHRRRWARPEGGPAGRLVEQHGTALDDEWAGRRCEPTEVPRARPRLRLRLEKTRSFPFEGGPTALSHLLM